MSKVELAKESSVYRIIVYNDFPVQEQRRVFNGMELTYHDGRKEIVSERDWKDKSRKIFVPKKFGGRNHVANNWHRYSQFVLPHTS
jgi:hypothetical protein